MQAGLCAASLHSQHPHLEGRQCAAGWRGWQSTCVAQGGCSMKRGQGPGGRGHRGAVVGNYGAVLGTRSISGWKLSKG